LAILEHSVVLGLIEIFPLERDFFKVEVSDAGSSETPKVGQGRRKGRQASDLKRFNHNLNGQSRVKSPFEKVVMPASE
jgi:hypothetical protein